MKFRLDVTGTTPLLMHQDNLDHQDVMEAWIADPDNKKRSKPGDDRRPGFTWLGSLYHDGGLAVLTNEMLTKCFVNAGAKLIKKGTTSYKSDVASSVWLDGLAFPLQVDGKEVKVGALVAKLAEEYDYAKHCKEVAKCGFTLFAKRAAVNGSKHVRVRPRFDPWAVTVTGELDTDGLTKDMFERIVAKAGSRIGVGDWRPSAKQSPGPFGMFKTTVAWGK